MSITGTVYTAPQMDPKLLGELLIIWKRKDRERTHPRRWP